MRKKKKSCVVKIENYSASSKMIKLCEKLALPIIFTSIFLVYGNHHPSLIKCNLLGWSIHRLRSSATHFLCSFLCISVRLGQMKTVLKDSAYFNLPAFLLIPVATAPVLSLTSFGLVTPSRTVPMRSASNGGFSPTSSRISLTLLLTSSTESFVSPKTTTLFSL